MIAKIQLAAAVLQKKRARPCSQAHCLVHEHPTEMDATMTIGVVTMLYRFIGTLPRGKR
jgi:hypothetical protein